MRTVTIASKAYDAERDVSRVWLDNRLTRVGAVLGAGLLTNLAAVCWDVERNKAIWDVMTVTETEGHCDPAFTPDLSRVAAVHANDYYENPLLSVFDLGKHGRTTVLADNNDDSDTVTVPSVLTLTDDGTHLIAPRFEIPGRKQYLRRWEFAKPEVTLDPTWRVQLKVGQMDYETALAASPDGKLVACGYYSGVVRLVRVANGREVASFQAGLVRGKYSHPQVKRLAFSPDGTQLAALTYQRMGGKVGYKATVWDVPSGAKAASVKEPGSVNGFAFHPNGRTMLTARSDGLVGVWDTETWKSSGSFDWKIGQVFSVAFSPDGLMAAAGGEKGRIVIWDVEE